MNKPLLALAVVAAAVAACVVLLSPSSVAQDEEDIPSVNAIMQMDVTPLIEQMRALELEVAAMRDSMSAMQKALEEGQIMQLEMVQLLNRLTPERWDYKIVHSRSEKALETAGQAGWELVTISNEDWLYFRRPARAERMEETER